MSKYNGSNPIVLILIFIGFLYFLSSFTDSFIYKVYLEGLFGSLLMIIFFLAASIWAIYGAFLMLKESKNKTINDYFLIIFSLCLSFVFFYCLYLFLNEFVSNLRWRFY